MIQNVEYAYMQVTYEVRFISKEYFKFIKFSASPKQFGKFNGNVAIQWLCSYFSHEAGPRSVLSTTSKSVDGHFAAREAG